MPVPITSISTAHCATNHPPCAVCPDNWDLEVGSIRTWREAIRTCLACPFLESCHKHAEKLTAQGNGPRSIIWAGVVYNAAGHKVEDISRYRRPSKAIRGPIQINHLTTAPNSERSTSAATTTIRRHFVMGRRGNGTGV